MAGTGAVIDRGAEGRGAALRVHGGALTGCHVRPDDSNDEESRCVLQTAL